MSVDGGIPKISSTSDEAIASAVLLSMVPLDANETCKRTPQPPYIPTVSTRTNYASSQVDHPRRTQPASNQVFPADQPPPSSRTPIANLILLLSLFPFCSIRPCACRATFMSTSTELSIVSGGPGNALDWSHVRGGWRVGSRTMLTPAEAIWSATRCASAAPTRTSLIDLPISLSTSA